MEAKPLIPRHIGPDLNQIHLALVDCARQFRYTARNVPGTDSAASETPRQSSIPRPPLPRFLGSVGHLADSLLETAETYAGHAIPPLQDHWKLPVDIDIDVESLAHCPDDTKRVRTYSAVYYAAAKRFVLRAGAADVLIFEHRINEGFIAFCNASRALSSAEQVIVAPQLCALSDVCRMFARLSLLMIDKHPIRSARFVELPDVVAPWWLIAEPNAYVFLLLGLLGCAKRVCPDSLPADPDRALSLAADILGTRESKFRELLRERVPEAALEQEFASIVKFL
ncbi:hypothetical protein [Trinickia sp.]|uniref:hypothetical protein n=1 Tax=Trinickia sp. TaxID=2571163 RepID=UPI003F81F168